MKHFLILCLLGTALHAQDTNPPTRLPEVVVSGAVPKLNEEKLVGPYEQPAWTTHRRFPTTRVYLQQAPWQVGFEQWWRGRFFRDGTHGQLFQEEIEVGLPYRMQLDLYENWIMGNDLRLRHHDVAGELRWALADWGKIPLNPTLYGEWKSVDKSQGPDVFEIKLLLGEEIAPRWHWGLNVAWEQEVGALRHTELAWSQAISYTLLDERFSVGMEMEFKHETDAGARSLPAITFLIGPSVQWLLNPRMHLDLVPLIGVTRDAPRVETFVVFSIELGGFKSRPSRPAAPTSLRGN